MAWRKIGEYKKTQHFEKQRVAFFARKRNCRISVGWFRLESPDVKHVLLEGVAVDSLVAHIGAVVIDGWGWTAQKLLDFCAVWDAKFQKGIDAKFGVKPLVFLRTDLGLWTQQGIEVFEEIRVDMEECLLENVVELVHFLVDVAGGLDGVK